MCSAVRDAEGSEPAAVAGAIGVPWAADGGGAGRIVGTVPHGRVPSHQTAGTSRIHRNQQRRHPPHLLGACGSMAALQIQKGLFHWKVEHEGLSYDIFYCLEKVAFVCRDGLYSGESVLYSIHSNIGSLIGIRLQDDFWLFAHHEPNLVNAYHIGEFYLREISDRFRKAAFIADFKKKSYSWVQETVGKLYCIALPEGYYPHTVNYLFTIHVACTDLYLLEGYSETSNQPTFFELDI